MRVIDRVCPRSVQMLKELNIDAGVRAPVVTTLLDLVDVFDDDEGEAEYDIKYEEFARFLSAEDVTQLFPGPTGGLGKFAARPETPPEEAARPVTPRGGVSVRNDGRGRVTEAEIVQAHTMMREIILTKFGAFGKAFRCIDENASGYISRFEFHRLMAILNLAIAIRRPVIEAIIDLMDTDRDGAGHGEEIQYREFAKYMSCEDILKLASPEQLAIALRGDPVPPPKEHFTEVAAASGKDSARKKKFVREGMMRKAPTPRQGVRRGGMGGSRTARDNWLAAKSQALANAEAALAQGVQGPNYLRADAMSGKDLKLEIKASHLPAGVTVKDLMRVHRQVQMKIKDKYLRMSDAFKWMDKDRTGTITREEFEFTVYNELLLTNISQGEFEGLCNLMDSDKNGTIEYTEFARVITADQVETTWQQQLTGGDDSRVRKGEFIH